jgi:hypothetical protein
MAAIGKGDYVECVYDWGYPGLSRGAVFLCDEVRVPTGGPCGACRTLNHGALTLRGLPHPYGPGWCGCGFRPIYRPKQELIQSLKAPPINARTREREIV